MAGGLHPQAVCQIEGFNGIIKCGGAIVGRTWGVGQSMGVDSRNQAILVVDVGGELSVLGTFVMSVGLLATTSAVTLLSLGRSVSARTTIGPSLLLLLGELWVCLLVLHSTKLVGPRGLAAAAVRCALLLKRESGRLDDAIGLQSLILLGKV